MAAIIQAIDESIDNGQTTVLFGPPSPVEADNLIGLFRALRVRRFAWSESTRAVGTTSGSGQVELSGASARQASSHGGGASKRKRIADADPDANTQTVDIDPASIQFADSGDKAALTMQLREILCLEEDAGNLVYKRRQALVSESYHSGAAINASSIYAFGCTLNEAGTEVTVAAGKVRLHGIVAVALSLATKTLSGSTCYVYVRYVRNGKSATIEISSTEPSAAEAGYVNVPLASYTSSAGIYSLSVIHHIGDINFDAPMG
jgi:hypothetical protein